MMFLFSQGGFLGTLDLLLAVLFSVIVISQKRDPAVTLAWVLVFFLIPFLSLVLYAFLGYQHVKLRRRVMPNPIHRLNFMHETADLRAGIPPALRNVETLAERLTEYPVLGGNRVRVYDQSDATDAALSRAIREARHHVHMSYYIFEPDSTGAHFRNLLAEQARRGVHCRLLMDAVGSYRVRKSFLKPLHRAGVQTSFFSPFRTFNRPWALNFRNHRKLTVVDGHVGFLGSQNIGHHFWRSGSRRLHWRETDVRLEGPAVAELQTVFAEDWHFATAENLTGDHYFPAPQSKGSTLVQALPTGPNKRENALAMIFLEAVHSARERVTITTPYFIPTLPVALALQAAARKGVRVDLLLPHHTDHPVVAWAGRSWFKDLLDSGVRIYEYRETFLHSKVVTVDGQLALVGSANMDTRSFLINFELSLLLYDNDVAGYLQKRFDHMIERAAVVEHDELSELSLSRQFLEGFCRVLSPLL